MHLLLSALFFTGAAKAPYCGPDAFRAPAAAPFGSGNGRALRCRVYRLRAPNGTLSLGTATNERDRERGLMDVRAMPARVGMLFKFVGGDGLRAFWMKNTLIPLDMVFVRADGTVSIVAEDVPSTLPTTPDERIPRRYGAGQYVIELNAGEAARDGLVRGVRLTLPGLEAT